VFKSVHPYTNYFLTEMQGIFHEALEGPESTVPQLLSPGANELAFVCCECIKRQFRQYCAGDPRRLSSTNALNLCNIIGCRCVKAVHHIRYESQINEPE